MQNCFAGAQLASTSQTQEQRKSNDKPNALSLSLHLSAPRARQKPDAMSQESVGTPTRKEKKNQADAHYAHLPPPKTQHGQVEKMLQNPSVPAISGRPERDFGSTYSSVNSSS